MLTEERHRYIKAALRQQGVVKAKDLMQALTASESTIRRDLQDLEEQGACAAFTGARNAWPTRPLNPASGKKPHGT